MASLSQQTAREVERRAWDAPQIPSVSAMMLGAQVARNEKLIEQVSHVECLKRWREDFNCEKRGSVVADCERGNN